MPAICRTASKSSGEGEAGLDDVHVEQLELPGDLQFLRRVQRRARGLLPVAQRRVEDPDDRQFLGRWCLLGCGHLQLPPFVWDTQYRKETQ